MKTWCVGRSLKEILLPPHSVRLSTTPPLVLQPGEKREGGRRKEEGGRRGRREEGGGRRGRREEGGEEGGRREEGE